MLVHGAWHGGWCYSRLATRLRAAGNDVFAPSLTGLADRSHLLGAGVDLQMHIDDIVNLLRWNDLEDVVLAGHSYGGFVISGVADAVPERLRGLVYLDAFVPADGESFLSVAHPKTRAAVIAAAEASGGVSVPPFPADGYVDDPADRALVEAKCTPHPFASFAQPLYLSGAGDAVASRTYVRATRFAARVFDAYRARCAADPHWTTIDVDANHDLMLERPDELAEILGTI